MNIKEFARKYIFGGEGFDGSPLFWWLFIFIGGLIVPASGIYYGLMWISKLWKRGN